jgi:ABC-type nitrate/sulfonate/bicarbonate transport system permease component
VALTLASLAASGILLHHAALTLYRLAAGFALAAVPFVLTLWPPLLMGLYTFSKQRARAAGGDEKEAHHD